MMTRGMVVDGKGGRVVLFSALSVVFTFTHSVEDFQYNIAARFGLPVLLAAFLLALAYAGQVYGTALAARDRWQGYFINLILAVIWFVGAVGDHLGEILFANPYRSGLVSKGLEVGIIVMAAVWAWASFRAWGQH
jgi:hypothetical protein